MSRSSPYSNRQFSLWRDRFVPALMLGAMAGGLWWTRPAHKLNYRPPGSMLRTQTCLSNQGRIAQAFAEYAQDYDGKFPRGVDPEDHTYPELWQTSYTGNFYQAARTAPMLHDLLYPYIKDRNVWHCPDDTGWEVSKLNQTLLNLPDSDTSRPHLQHIKPSSWARFGTSYYYLTAHGFAGMRAADLKNPYSEMILFDGELWHQPGGTPSVNVLFGDGHSENILPNEFVKHLRRW